MKHQLFSILLVLLGTFEMTAQTISGTIHETTGNPVEFANVLLYKAADSSLVKGAVTDVSGAFVFENTAAGTYFIQSSMVGLGSAVLPPFRYDGDMFKTGNLVLQQSSIEMATVTVVGKKPIIEVQAGKTILNVEGALSATGQTALEVLRKAPGVLVDNNDNITLKGKNGIKFLVDGRELPLDNADLATLLKSMRAEEIQAIEIIANPGAQFDAAGNAGVIQIRTRKLKTIGTNGTLNLNGQYGQSAKGSLDLGLNHRNETVNVYGNYGNFIGDYHNELGLYRVQNGRIFDQVSTMRDVNRNHHYKLGADYAINDKQTIGILVDGRWVHGPWHNNAITKISSAAAGSPIDSLLIATNDVPQDRLNNTVNLNYRYADTTGRSFNFDINQGFYRNRANSYQPNYYTDPTESQVFSSHIYRTNTPQDIALATAKIDYEQPLGPGKMGIGAKYAAVKTDNIFDFFDELDGVVVKNDERSNQFEYREKIAAAYANYGLQVKKWSLQTGLRWENTEYTGDLTSSLPGRDSMVNNQYNSFFPSASLAYQLNKNNGLTLSYSRRIDRPSYRDLNPFEEKLDELTYKKGNPRLKPQFTNSFELGHNFMGFFNTTLGFSRTSDVFTEVIDTAEGNRTFLSNDNIAQQDNWSLSISTPLPIAKWWEGYLSVTAIKVKFDAYFRPGFAYSAAYKTLNLYNEHTFKLPKGWSLQCSGYFNAPSIAGAVFRVKAQGAVDVGVQKKVLKDHGTVRLAFSDIFRTAAWNSVNDFTPGLYMKGHSTWESQMVSVNFNYRFGSTTIKDSRNRQTGSEEESRRVK